MNPISQNMMMSKMLPMLSMLKSANDPMAMLQQMAKSNPQMQNALDITNNVISASNGDLNSALYKIAQQNGIDPNQVLNMLR